MISRAQLETELAGQPDVPTSPGPPNANRDAQDLVTRLRARRRERESRPDNGKVPRHLAKQARRRGWSPEQLRDLLDAFLEDHWYEPEDLHELEEVELL